MAKKHDNPHIGQSLNDFIAEEKRRDPGFAAEFDRLQLARRLRELREELKVTQGNLAALVGTKQPAIARFERGESQPTFDFVSRVASALGHRLEVKVVPKGKVLASRTRSSGATLGP